MEQGIFLCPFSQRASMTFLFSWMVSIQVKQEVDIHSNEIALLSQQFGVHPTTLRRQLDSIEDNTYFSVQKRAGGYHIKRSALPASYLSLSIPSSFFRKHALSPSESVLFSAILVLQKKKKLALTRKALAGRTGFSLRQVCYSLQSLKNKGLLISTTQREGYVRHTQEGRIEDIRERKVYSIPQQCISKLDCKIAPLKDLIKNPVINNGSLDTSSKTLSSKQENKSDLIPIWQFYKQNFQEQGFESLQSSLAYLHQKGKHQLDGASLIEMFKSAKDNLFLKLANKFGWQEAVVECYGRAGALISDSSRHIGKYKAHKPGFAWFVLNAQDILQGKYNPRAQSYKQKSWEQYAKARPLNATAPARERKTVPTLSLEEHQQNILGNNTLSALAKRVHVKILHRAGGYLYKSWVSTCSKVREEGGIIHITAPTKFLGDMIDSKVLVPHGLSSTIWVGCA